MTSPRVAIIVLNWNGRDDTLACLASLKCLHYLARSIIVVDNGSTDDSVSAISAQYPEVHFIETGANLGYAGGNNIGLQYACTHGYDYTLLLNNDTEVAADFLDHLVEVCERDPRIGVAGPKIYYADRPRIIWSAGGVIDWKRGGRTFMRGIEQKDDGKYNVIQTVDFVTGCALLIRNSTLVEIGLVDQRFGMYYEETEWCVRIARGGWKMRYVPNSHVWHKIRTDRQDWSPRITYYMARNRLLFLRLTHAPLSAWLHAALIQDLRTWISWRVRRRWRGRAKQRIALRRAWRDYLLNRFGMVDYQDLAT